MKKALSCFLAVIMLICALNTGESVFGASYPYTYTDNYGKIIYNRYSNGRIVEFNTDYDDMVSYFKQGLLNRETELEYKFATTDTRWEYYYYEADQIHSAQDVAFSLVNSILDEVFGVHDTEAGEANGGDYLFKNINATIDETGYSLGDISPGIYASVNDDPAPGAERYFTFDISITGITYDTTEYQDRMIAQFVRWFNSNYILDGMTEYEKVKTIYDFIVRNCTYDFDLYNDKQGTYSPTSERYITSHSAYGALFGNKPELFTSADVNFDELFAHKESVTGQPVVESYDNGLAVCEGYSMLFYYMCVSNGVRCRIVDGNYVEESGHASDPHEWNYVYLDDGHGDGWQWYQVDCTFASQKSYKQIDLNDYDYFLGGYESVYFGYKNHQEAYANRGFGILAQLYDWYEEGNKPFAKDYRFSRVNLYQDKLNQGYILKRTTHHSDDDTDYYGFILCNSEGMKLVEITEEGVYLAHTDGFIYNGMASRFEVLLPYIVNRINITEEDRYAEGEYVSPLYVTDTDTGYRFQTVKDSGEYSLEIEGANNTSLTILFEIEKRDMSSAAIDGKSVVSADTYANYNGNAIIPSVSITDPYKNDLVMGRDYTLSYVKGGKTVNEIKDIGDYKVVINYIGNYCGNFPIDFVVDKIKFEYLSTKSLSFKYYPLSIRQKESLLTPVDYYNHGTPNGIKVGDLTLKVGKDYSVSSSGGVEYGNKGTVTIKGLSAGNVIAGSKKSIAYTVDQKYSITYLDGTVADTNTTNKLYYTGKEIKPTTFDVLDKTLVRGKDYKIVSYYNNVEIGYAYVKIQGIGGCTGSASLKFYINKPANFVEPSKSGNTISASSNQFVYTGKAHKPKISFKNAKGKAVSTFYYTVSYSNYTNVGKGCATIKLRHGYSGTFKVYYTILPKPTKLTGITSGKGKVTIKWKKQSTQTTGYQIMYSTSSRYKNAKYITVTSTATLKRTIKKLKRKKLYFFTVRTYKKKNGRKYYSSWSSGLGIYTK